MARRVETTIVRSQWRAILLVLGMTPWLVLRPAAEPFQLPKATFIVLVGLGLAWLLAFRTAQERHFSVARTPFLAPYLAYVLAALFATVTSADAAISLWGEYRYFVGFFLILAVAVVVIALLRDPEVVRYRTVAVAIVAGAVPVTLYALLQLVGADPFDWSGEVSGVFSTMANPNFLAGYLGIVFPLAAVVAVLPRISAPIRVGAGVLSLLIVLVVLGTASFQGPVVLLVGASLPWGLLLLRRLGPPVFVAAIAAGFVVAAVVGAVFARPIWAQIGDGLRERTMMWEAALNIFRGDPVVGTGFATFGLFFTPNRPPEHARSYGFVNPEQAHNVALNHLAEGGMILFLPWLLAVLVVGYLLVRGMRREEGERQLLVAGFGGAWLAYQSQALVSIDLPVTVLLHWTSAAVIAGLSVRPDETWTWGAQRVGRRTLPYEKAMRVATVGVVLVLAWFVIVPLRADVNAASGFKTANGGDLQSGTERIATATDLAPHRASYWLLLASVREGSGDIRGALDALREAASRDGGSSQQALAVGRFADRNGELRLAADWFERAVLRDPFNPGVLDPAAIFFDSIGEFERARELEAQLDAVRSAGDGAQRPS